MELTSTIKYKVTFQVVQIYATEGGMEWYQFGEAQSDIKEAIQLLELKKADAGKLADTWYIISNVEKIIK